MTKPKLTLSQRFEFDALGYVLLRGVLTADEVASCKAALYRMKSDPDLDGTDVYRRPTGEHRVLMGNLVAYDPALLGYATHPKLIPLVEEVVGARVRLEETEAIINSRDPEDSDARFSTGSGCLPRGSTEVQRQPGAAITSRNDFTVSL